MFIRVVVWKEYVLDLGKFDAAPKVGKSCSSQIWYPGRHRQHFHDRFMNRHLGRKLMKQRKWFVLTLEVHAPCPEGYIPGRGAISWFNHRSQHQCIHAQIDIKNEDDVVFYGNLASRYPCQIWRYRLAASSLYKHVATKHKLVTRMQPTFIPAVCHMRLNLVLRCDCFGSPGSAISCDLWHRQCGFAPTSSSTRKKSTLVLHDCVRMLAGLGFRDQLDYKLQVIVLPQALQICGCHQRSASTAMQWSHELRWKTGEPWTATSGFLVRSWTLRVVLISIHVFFGHNQLGQASQ